LGDECLIVPYKSEFAGMVGVITLLAGMGLELRGLVDCKSI